MLVLCVLIIIPQYSRPETGTPFFLRCFPTVPMMFVCHDITWHHCIVSVSYTHLDVYKRQYHHCSFQLLLFRSPWRKLPKAVYGNGCTQFQCGRYQFPDRIRSKDIYRNRCLKSIKHPTSLKVRQLHNKET